MNHFRTRVLTVASLSVGLCVPAKSFAASLVQVNKSDWTGGVSVPSYVQMYIYVPDTLAAKPPIMVSAHSCGSTATGQMGNIPKSKAAADANGFILILPDNPGQNCWDVGATPSLTHDGGGDTKAVVQMVKYALMKYSGDAARVYAMGGSSGAMLTQALMAVYPDVFRAGSARAGVPAGCWADGYASSNQWSDRCAGGQTTKSAQQWGDQVRAMYPGYTGHRPRLQIMQGENDTTISYKNTAESIKEWTNVLGLSTEPSSTDMGYKAANATYNRQFWKNACGFSVFEAWSSPGGTHSMPYEEDDILKFFGLNVKGGADPETDCNGMTGGAGGAPATGGMGGTSGGGTMAGSPGMAGAGGVGMSTGGMGPSAGGSGGVGMSTGGTGGTSTGTGGSGGSGGAPSGTGGVSMGAGGTGGTGGTAMGTGGTATGTGGTATGNAGAGAKAGSPATGAGGSSTGPNPGTGGDDDQGGGCSIGATQHGRSTLAAMFGLALLAFRRRQRRARG